MTLEWTAALDVNVGNLHSPTGLVGPIQVVPTVRPRSVTTAWARELGGQGHGDTAEGVFLAGGPYRGASTGVVVDVVTMVRMGLV